MSQKEKAPSVERYPFQAAVIGRPAKMLGIDAMLFAPQEDDQKCSPLELHNGFSRFVFTIVDKSDPKGVITPRANIPCRDLACIKARTDVAMHLLLAGNQSVNVSGISENGGASQSSPAFTQKLFLTQHKGKSPAEVLIANPQERENLIKGRDLLQANLAKYPRNKDQIVAIDEAIRLLDEGKLQGASATVQSTGSSVLPIYKTEYKQMSQQDERGYYLVYRIQIVFDATKKYPFTLEIANCFAPVETRAGGQRHPIMDKRTNDTVSSISLSDAEWIDTITHLTNLKGYFELTNFRSAMAMAQKHSYQNKA